MVPVLSSDWLIAGHVVPVLSSDWLIAGHVVPVLSSDWLIAGHVVPVLSSDRLIAGLGAFTCQFSYNMMRCTTQHKLIITENFPGRRSRIR